MRLDFVRGHMGGNLIILLRGDQVSSGHELETAVKLLGPNYLSAHEAGILYPAEEKGQIKVKIAEASLPSFISACGGLTQVLGAALIETELGNLFGIDRGAPKVEVLLHTDGGKTAFFIDAHDRKAEKIRTDMTNFVKESYDRGIGRLEYRGLEFMQAGKFLVLNGDRFREVYPEIDLERWDRHTRKTLSAIQRDFQNKTGEIEPNVVVYDWNPEHEGHVRVAFPHYVDNEYFEPSCGTGSIALGIALLASGELENLKPDQKGRLALKLESGGGIELGGPEITTLEMDTDAGVVKSSVFSHSLVEITSVGEARL